MIKNLKYFEDLDSHGLKPCQASHTLTREEILLMANTYDPAPFHLSDELAQKWGHPTISAPGVLTEAICIKLLHEGLEPIAAIGLAGKELTLPVPFYAGDTVTLWYGVLDKRISKSKSDRGIARLHFVLKNQNEQIIYDAIHTILVFRKPKD